MQTFFLSPFAMVQSVWLNRQLILSLVKRDVVGRYRGSVLGILWSLFNPVFMLAVYTFVFSIIFKARWNTESESKTEFALILFAGLIVFNIFSDCANRAPSLILSNANYVKKVIFPLEILPIVSLGSTLFHFVISLAVWLAAYWIFFGTPHVTALMLPFVILPLLLFVIGLTWGLASLGVYLRDVSQFIGIVTTVMLFVSPIFYPASAIPPKYQHIVLLNPLAPIIEQARNVLFWGVPPDWPTLCIYLASSSVIAWLGFVWFQKTRKGFADVI